MATILATASGNFSAGATWVGGVAPGPGDVAVANGKVVTLNQNITCAEVRNDTTGGATAGGYFTFAANVTLTANVYSGSVGSYCLLDNVSNAAATQTVVGNLMAGGTYCASFTGTGGTTIVVGNITGGSVANALGIQVGERTVAITGNVLGGSNTNTYGVYAATAAGIVTITGSVTGGSGNGSIGLYAASSTGITVTGTVTGGSGVNAQGVYLYSSYIGAITINGNVVGGTGSSAYGVYNIGTLNCVINGIAVGNNYPNGVAYACQGVYCYSDRTASVNGIKRGSGGFCGAFGRVFLNSAAANTAEMRDGNLGATITLIESSAAGDYPAAVDVRSGVTYNFDTAVGTCSVPIASSVAAGVPVDNMVGTAILSAEDITESLSPVLDDTSAILARIAEQVPDGPVLVIPAPGAANTTTAYGYALDNENNLVSGVVFELVIVALPGDTAPMTYPKGVHTASSDADGVYIFSIPRGTGFRFKLRRGSGSFVQFYGVDDETLALPELLG